MERNLFTSGGREARPAARLLVAACAAALAAGLFVQHALGYPPCSLCVMQRLAFAAALVLALPLALGRPGPKAFPVLAAAILAAVLLGLGVAGYQVWQNAFPSGVARCGRGIAGFFDDTPLEAVAGWLLDAPGDCAKPPRFFGIVTMPQLGLLAFLALLHPALRVAGAARRA
jgi:protein dithiol:quinone oxidoreductase